MRYDPYIRPDLDFDDKIEVYESFLAEIEMLSNSNHKNITQMIEAIRDEIGNLFIIMEYFEEGDLEAMRIRDIGGSDHYYEEEQLIDIFRQICEGI